VTVRMEPTAIASETPAMPVAATKADIEHALVRAEAMASAKARPTEARKLEKRIARIREVLATTPATQAAATAPAKKMGLAQRLMTKHMDKKIQRQLAPEQPMRSSTLTAGLVIGLIGLLLLLLTSGTAATIGFIALIAGIVLVILGLL
jgi:heme O synthase-like polyprenyltransferase